MDPKRTPKSMDFEVENSEKSFKKRIKKQAFFSMDFSSILTPFWRVLGRVWEASGRFFARNFSVNKRKKIILS